MTVNTIAYFLYPMLGGKESGTGYSPGVSMGMAPEGRPSIIWGQGTPDGDRSPFVNLNKGSLYLCVNNTDDQACIYQKVDEGGDDNDWVLVFAENHAKIDTADLAAAAGVTNAQLAGSITNAKLAGSITNAKLAGSIVGSKLLANARRNFAVTKDFNIDNGTGTTDDDIVLVPSDGITIVAVRAVYVEATDSGGAASANFKVGTAVGGAEIVAATALEVSKAVGTKTAATLVTAAGAIAADGMIAVRHTGIAATEAGQYFVQIEYTVDD